MKSIIPSLLLFVTTLCYSQGEYVLQMDFDGCVIEDQSSFQVPVNTVGSPTCVCSPIGDALFFDGIDDALTIRDTNLEFRQAFSLSMTFRPDGTMDDQRLMSYKESCNSVQGFDITYHNSTNSLTIELYESINRRVFYDQQLDDKQCWHAVTIIKAGSNYLLYLYGDLVFQGEGATSLDVGQNGTLTIGSGPCVPGFANSFQGAIDYISVYNEVLPVAEIQSRVIVSDRIITPDALIFLGESITPEVDAPCATGFQWFPTAGVSNASIAEPVLAPMETTIYGLQIQDGGCQVTDSIRVLVVDPNEVTCETLILPSAFTPNGDNLNDTYFISNGFVVDELIRFEIFDRWGGKLFSTSDVNQEWDGTHRGETVMPGVYVFKAEYVCQGETKTQAGSFSVLN